MVPNTESKTNHSHMTHHVSKTGRKGDPRMHRAVAARLANPKLSLYEALRRGGFDYPTDDDSSIIDAEQISLGQRKNQLSRRVRMAKKQQQESPASASTRRTRQQAKSSDMTADQSLSGLLDPPEHYDNDDSSMVDECAETAMEEESSAGGDKASLVAKFHPQYHPLIPAVQLNQGASIAVSRNQLAMENSHPLHGATAAALHHGSPEWSTLGGVLASATTTTTPPASGVAVAALARTASSLGLTLEQLAVALQSSSNLAQVLLSGTACFRSQQDLALALYRNEAQALYGKAMLLAGFPINETREGTASHLAFAMAAWREEGDRLKRLIAESAAPDEAPMESDADVDAVLDVPEDRGETSAAPDSPRLEQRESGSTHHLDHDHHSHSHSHHDHGGVHSHSHSSPHHQLPAVDCALDGGRHIHRLEGKCGHKAILHHPSDGHAHIDFVVGNKIECYQGVRPVAQGHSDNASFWPSGFSCEDLSCATTCWDGVAIDDHQHSDACPAVSKPRTFDLQEIALDGKEWIHDFQNDESLLGLFKLGDSPSKTSNDGGRDS